MASQQPDPGRASGADAKEAKAKKWAAFRAQTYDGEGWGDDYGGDASPPREPAPTQRVTPSNPPTDVAASRSIQPEAPLPSPPPFTNGSAASLPSQTPGSQINTELGRGPALSGPPHNLKRESLVSPSQSPGALGSRPGYQQLVEQRPASPTSRGPVAASAQPDRPADPYRRTDGAKLPDTPELGRGGNASNPASPATLQTRPPPPMSKDETSSQGPGQALNTQHPRTLTNAPSTTLADSGSPRPDSDRRFSRSPQLPDLARMSMFGDDFFTTSLLNEDPPPPMPSMPSPSAFSIGGVVGQSHATAASVSPPGPTAVQSQPQQTSPALTSPSLTERSMPISSSGIRTSSPQATAQSELSAAADLSRRSGTSSLVSEAVGNAGSPRLSSALGRNDMAGQNPLGPAAESASNISSLHGPRLSEHSTRDLSPSPLRSMSPAVDPAGPVVPSGNRSVQDGAPDSIPPRSPDTKSTAGTDNEPTSAQHPRRQSTMDTTTSSTPKESDMLREEIIQSLSSPAVSDEAASQLRTRHQRNSTVDSGVRESSYLPSLYDDYWETTAEDQDDTPVPQVPPLHTETSEGMPIAPLRPISKSPGKPAVAAPSQPLRERFSWEGGQVRPAESPTSTKPQSAEEPTAPLAGTDSAESLEAGEPKPEEEKAVEERGSGQGPSDVSRQESQVSKATAVDDDDGASSDPKRLSLAAEKQIMENSTEHPQTDPVENHPALRESPMDTSPRPPAKILSFREIMALGTPNERIHKFDETRSHFAGMDQGLDNWIAGLKSQPEHHGASAVYSATGMALPNNASPAAQRLHSPTSASMGQSQQPYHQQYLNASTAHTGAHGQPSMMGPGLSTPGSAFKHSSNQAGVKSKELLLAAGKAGKGLLSKGKNKLRGSTGDKNDSSPPYTPPMPQSDRRQSWGSRFGTGASAKSDTPLPGQLQQPTPDDPNAAPRPQVTHRSPNGAVPQLQPPPARVLSASEEPVSPVSEAHSRASSINGDDASAPQGGNRAQSPRLADKTQRWAPATTSPLAERAPPATAGEAVPGDAGVARAAEGDDTSEDWTGVSPGQHLRRRPTGASEASETHTLGQDGRLPGSDAAGNDQPAQQDGPLPRFSFDGLPPIRRGSTFGLNPGDGAEGPRADAVSKAEGDEGSNDGNSGVKVSREPQAESLPATSEPPPGPGVPLEEPLDSTTLEGDTLGNDFITTEGQLVNLAKQKSLLAEEPTQHPAVAGSPPPGAGDESTAPSIPRVDEPQAPVIAVESPSAHVPPTAPPPTGDQPSTLAHAGPSIVRNLPPHMTANPIQSPPPGGQWNLQESYLSEPLISPSSRKRPTSAGSQTPPFAGYDKETGEGGPEPTADSSDDEGSAAGGTSKEGASKGRRDSHVEDTQKQEPLRDTQAGERPEVEPGQPFPGVDAAPSGVPASTNVVSQSVSPGPRAPQKYGATPPVSIQRYRGLFAPKQEEQKQQRQGFGLPGQTQYQGLFAPKQEQPPPQARKLSGQAQYHGLFGSKQPQPQAYGHGQQPPPSQSHPAPAESRGAFPGDTDAAPSTPLSSRPPTADSRDRRTPGIFNQISDRLTKMGAQSGTQGRPDTAASAAGDGVSEASVPSVEPRNRRRSSFFLSLKGASAADAGPRSGDSMAGNATSTLGDRDQPTPEPEEAPRRSFFGVGKGRASTAGPLSSSSSSRFVPGLSRSSAAETDAAREGGQGRARFGGLGKFWRSSGGQDGASLPEKPGSSGSSAPSAHSRPATGGHASLTPPQVRGRSGTTGSIPGSPGPSPLAQTNAVPGERGRRVSGPGAFISNVWSARSLEEANRHAARAGEVPQRIPQHGPRHGPQYGPQYGPAGGGAQLGSRQFPPDHQVPRAPGALVPGGPNQQPTRFGPLQHQGQAPPGHARYSPMHERQTSAPGPVGPPPGHGEAAAYPAHQHASTPGSAAPTQRPPLSQLQPYQGGMMPTSERGLPPVMPQAGQPGQGQQAQAWRPVPAQQGGGSGMTEPSAQNAPQDLNQGRLSRGAVAEDGPVGHGPVPGTGQAPAESQVLDKTDASPVISATTSPDPDLMSQSTAPERETTPKVERLPSDVQTARGDEGDVRRVTSGTSEPPTAVAPGSLLASPVPQQAQVPVQQRASNSTHLDGAPAFGSESAQPDPGQSQGAASLAGREGASSSGAPTPQGPSPALTPAAHMVLPSQSTGQMVGVNGAPALRQALPQGQVPAGQIPGQLPHGLRPGPMSQGQPGPLPGQLPQGQAHHGQPPQPGALQGQWRQYAPVPGQQMHRGPVPPGQLQGPPAPWGPNPNGAGALHGNSPVQFHAAVTPPSGQQPQRPEQQNQGQGGVSRWLKGISSGQQPAQQQQQQQQAEPVQGKSEKSGKSLLSAFKRSSKVPEAKHSPAPQQQPMFAGAQGQHPGTAPGGYAQHPQQYGHPQFAADPRWVVAGSPYPQQMGQYGPETPQGPRQFAQAPFPGMHHSIPGQRPYAPGQPGQFQAFAPNQVQQGPSTAPSIHTSMTHNCQPGMGAAVASAGFPVAQGPAPPVAVTAAYQSSGQRGTPGHDIPRSVPRIGVHAEPSTAPDVDKPLPHLGSLEAQRSASASDVSQVSNVPSSEPPPPEGGSKAVATLEEVVRRKRPEDDRGDVSQSRGDATRQGRNLTLDVEAAKRRSDETNLYDATPRVVPTATREGTPASAGAQTTPRSQRSVQVPVAEPSSGQAVPPPLVSQDNPATALSRAGTDESLATRTTESSTGSTAPPTPPTEPPTQSTEPPTQPTGNATEPTEQATQGTQAPDAQPKPVESKQQELIRKMRLEAQEEKILVPGQEGLPGADQDDDDDTPKMSATSYPGQEWNPYGGHEFYYRE